MSASRIGPLMVALLVAALFERLGFEPVAPLLDERATGRALQALVTDELRARGPEDSLVRVYAGHGGTRKHRVGGREVKTGYLVPVDAAGEPPPAVIPSDAAAYRKRRCAEGACVEKTRAILAYVGFRCARSPGR